MELHVISVTPKAGISKGSGKPYSMRIVQGIYTDENAQSKICELTFFDDNARPQIPIIPNQKYTISLKFIVNFNNKGEAIIDTLVPVKKIAQAA